MNHDALDVGSLPPDGRARFQMESSGGGICVACGSSLGLEGPDGGCLNCLARFALAPEDDEADGQLSAAPARSFGHFEIVNGPDGWPVKLGRGAMGTTYRARDTVLRTEVALKVIGVNVAGHPAARVAFLREARAAAQLRHPNVASVFHYGEQDGECFYVMELVEGETLDARLRREGPLPPALVLEVGRQVTCALLEAEALGMVHRDLKPSNIMFDTRRGDETEDLPRIKVIDFGLAQAVDLAEAEDAQSASPGGFVGTPSFASPEQSACDGARPVDTRSDIYSLGVTLWFLLCGKLPFDGRTVAAIRKQQINQPLPLEHLHVAKTPMPVGTLLQTMLRADPGARPQSARELLDALQRCQDRLNGARSRGWTRALLFASVLCIALLTALVFRRTVVSEHALPTSALTPDHSLAVLPFENISPDPVDAFFTTGIQEQITAELGRLETLKVIGADSTRIYPPGERNLLRIGQELRVGHLVEGSVRRDSKMVKVSVRLVDLKHPGHPWTHQYDCEVKDAVRLQGDITRALADQLSVVLSPDEKTTVSKPPTSDAGAYDLYLRSHQGSKMYNSPTEFQQAYRDKIAMLKEAVARDPNFVAAYCAMSILYDDLYSMSLGDPAADRTVDHRALSEEALLKARQLNPDEGALHLAQGHHDVVVIHNYEEALAEANLARRTLPNDPEVEQVAGNAAQCLGRWEEAAQAFERAVTLQPREPMNLHFLTSLYRNMRRYEEADRATARLIALLPAEDAVYQKLFRATGPLEERVDLGPLRTALAEARPTNDTGKDSVENFRILLSLYAHEPDEVLRELAATKRSAFYIGESNYPKAWFEGLAARMHGDAAAAQTAFATARTDIEKAVLASPGSARKLSMLAVADAGMGHKEDALREGRRACEMMPPTKSAVSAAAVACNLAVVYAWTGETDLAFALLEDLVGRGVAGQNMLYQPTYGDLKLNPLWEPLRGDPRFAPLLQRLAPRPLL